MTLIGAFNVQNAVVLFADRQETIADYAKWDEGKIYLFESTGQYRVAMAGAGFPEPINQVWQTLWDKNAHYIAGYSINWPDYNGLKDRIIKTVHKVTTETIFPVPIEQRPNMELIWVIQALGSNLLQSRGGLDVFLYSQPLRKPNRPAPLRGKPSSTC
jgi:hypothetical protein